MKRWKALTFWLRWLWKWTFDLSRWYWFVTAAILIRRALYAIGQSGVIFGFCSTGLEWLLWGAEGI